jgi:hypothetical protein
MINEQRRHISSQRAAGAGAFCGAQAGVNLPSGARETMMNGMLVFAVMVGGTSLICYVLAIQSKYRRGNRRSAPDSFGPNSTDIFGAGDGSHFAGTGGHHSASDHSTGFGDSSSSGDSGGGDSSGGGGGDGGGGSSD